jgi:hypothetical protein
MPETASDPHRVEDHETVTVHAHHHLEHPPHRVRAEHQPQPGITRHRCEHDALPDRMRDPNRVETVTKRALGDNDPTNITE